MQAFIRPSMGQRDFNVDERVHYIKNICCLNSLNWTIFHNLLHFDFFFFTKVKIITALEGFKLMAWKQDVGKIWIWWLLLIWLLIYDQIGVTSAFFFYFKKGFFFGGGGVTYRRELISHQVFVYALLSGFEITWSQT